jgi:hypothetical protein
MVACRSKKADDKMNLCIKKDALDLEWLEVGEGVIDR